MSMLVDELKALGESPLAWGAVPAIAAFVYRSYHNWRKCPLLHRAPQLTQNEALELVGRPKIAGPRYFLLMVAGIVATVTSLSLIAKGIYPTLAFYLLIAGVFVIQTEPARLQVRDAEVRLFAAQPHGPAARAAAMERLDWTNAWLVTLQATMLAGVIAFLLAF
ncbi:MAG: hypothetical protein ACFBRM_16310 [Pikeienuella sp.]